MMVDSRVPETVTAWLTLPFKSTSTNLHKNAVIEANSDLVREALSYESRLQRLVTMPNQYFAWQVFLSSISPALWDSFVVPPVSNYHSTCLLTKKIPLYVHCFMVTVHPQSRHKVIVTCAYHVYRSFVHIIWSLCFGFYEHSAWCSFCKRHSDTICIKMHNIAFRLRNFLRPIETRGRICSRVSNSLPGKSICQSIESFCDRLHLTLRTKTNNQ